MTVILMIIPLIFLMIAIILYMVEQYYDTHGMKAWGKVVGYERSSSRSKNRNGSIFIPIIEYPFNGENVWIQPSGNSNIMYFKIGQQVELRTLNTGPEYVKVIGNKANGFLIGLFFFLSVFALAFLAYQTSFEHFHNKILLGLIISAVLGGIFYLYTKVPRDEFLKSALKKAKLVTPADFEKKFVFWNDHEIERLEQGNHKIAFTIVSVFTIVVTFLSTFLWGKLRYETQQELMDILYGKLSYTEIVPMIKEEQLLIVFLICLGINILILISFFSAFKKLK